MQRWISVAFGLVFAAAVLIVVLQAHVPANSAHSGTKPAPSASAGPGGSAAASDPTAPEPEPPDDPTPADAGADGSAFSVLPDGRPVPALPASAPRSVGFGVILFAYRGAEAAPKSAPTRQEALEKAQTLLEEAKKDFAEAAKKGDRGSTADAGRIPRGVLEPALEYVVFTLPKDTVYNQPLDTPRGWWIVRRND